jgi:hypothetical protein
VFNKGRQIAARHWELAEDGILVQCVCEKGWWCPANNKLYRPAGVEEIEKQILFQINQLKQEYEVRAKKISYYRESGDKSFPMYRLTLFGTWKEAEILAEARRKFDRVK